jgi:hypothetical protein
MRPLWLIGAAALMLMSLPTDVSAQRGGVHAGGGPSGFRGVTAGGSSGFRGIAGGHPGLAMHGGAVHGGIGRRGWGWKRGGGSWPIAIGIPAASVGYYNGSIDNGCLFLTHHGWMNTCF